MERKLKPFTKAWFLFLRRRFISRVRRVVAQLDDPGYVLASILLVGIALVTPWPMDRWLALTSYSAVWIFAGLMGISATLIALVYAATIFRGQYLASRLPPEIVGELIESRWHRASIWRLATVLIASLIVLASIDAQHLPRNVYGVLAGDIVLLTLCLIGIQGGIRRVFGRGYPSAVVSRTVRRLDDDYFNRFEQGVRPSLASGVVTETSDPFAVIEQVVTNALAIGDLTTAHLVLRAVLGRVLDVVKSNRVGARTTLGWIGDLYLVIGRKALERNERTAELIMKLFEIGLREALKLKLAWHERTEFLERLRDLRRAAIRERREDVEKEGLWALARTFKAALRVAPDEAKLRSFHETDAEAPPHDSEAELEWDHIERDWPWDIQRDLEAIAEGDLADTFGTGQFVQHMMLYDVLEATSIGLQQRRALLTTLLWQSKHVVLYALKRGRGERYVNWSLFGWHEFDSHQFGDLVPAAMNDWSEIIIEASRTGTLPPGALNEFAAAGRGFAGSENDERGIIIAETLGAIASLLSEHTDPEMAERYLEAASGLRSIGEWDNRETSELKRVVGAELAKFHEEEKRLRQWREAVPSRRRLPKDARHSRPWA